MSEEIINIIDDYCDIKIKEIYSIYCTTNNFMYLTQMHNRKVKKK